MRLQPESFCPASPRGLGDRRGRRVMLHGRLARIRGQNVLFSASRRLLFTLNDTAADIWCALEEGCTPGEVIDEMVAGGTPAADAERFVAAALDEWSEIGLAGPRPPAPGEDPGCERILVGLPGIVAEIACPPAHAALVRAPFAHLAATDGAAAVRFRVVEDGGRLGLFRDGGWVLSCAADELPTALKGEILTDVLGRTPYAIALHAACLPRDGRALLICGHPGAGKTTLSLAMLEAGFAFGGDDVTLVGPDGLCTGVPFAPAIKPGAWHLLAPYYPEMEALPAFRRVDGVRVRYPSPRNFARQAPCPAGWVVLVDRKEGAEARLDPLDPAEALRILLDGSFATGGELSVAGFEALAQLVGSAAAYRLTYSRLEDGMACLERECR